MYRRKPSSNSTSNEAVHAAAQGAVLDRSPGEGGSKGVGAAPVWFGRMPLELLDFIVQPQDWYPTDRSASCDVHVVEVC